VDDHAAMLALLTRLLEKEFTITGVVMDAESLMVAWRRARADVIVLDISLPGASGLQAAANLRAVGCPARIVFLSIDEAPEIVNAAWRVGGIGYVAKRDLAIDLIPAIRAALRGQRYVSAAINGD
jgi:DNA-binding NarL/FixJ family response regulator